MLLLVLAVTFSLLFSFVCSISEATLLSVGPARVEQLAQAGSRLGRLLQRYRAEPDRPIAAILIVNTISNSGGAAIATAQFTTAFPGVSEAWFAAFFVVTVLAVTEIVPKTVGVVHADSLAIPITGVVQVMIVAVWPMLFLTRWLARLFARADGGPTTSLDEIRVMATAGMSQGAFGQITGELIEQKGVARHVGIEGVDHPVSPGPHAAIEVVLIAVGVGVAGDVEPARRHPLAIPRRSEKSINLRGKRIGGGVSLKCGEFLRGRRQTGQVKGHPPQPGPPRCRWTRLETFLRQPSAHKPINRTPIAVRAVQCGRAVDLGQVWLDRWFKRPVGCPGSPLINPASHPFDLSSGELTPRFRRWHPQVIVAAGDSLEQFAGRRITRHDRRFGGGLFLIEPQIGLPLVSIWTVTGKAVRGQDRQDLAAEIDRRFFARLCSSQAGHKHDDRTRPRLHWHQQLCLWLPCL